jgi:hypothetical protein
MPGTTVRGIAVAAVPSATYFDIQARYADSVDQLYRCRTAVTRNIFTGNDHRTGTVAFNPDIRCVKAAR